MSNNTNKLMIRFSGSKNGTILAHYWSASMGGGIPWPGCGRWLRMGLAKARHEIATETATQYFVTGNFPDNPGF